MNCDKYDTDDKCQECELGFKPNDEKTSCNAIQLSKCLKINSADECTVCEEGFILVNDTCQPVYSFLSEFC